MQKCLIIGDGHIPGHAFLFERWNSYDLIIACDGAANFLLAHDLYPDVIIGDMDSFNPARVNNTDNILTLEQADQNTNDLEKALIHARKNSATHVEIAGALGKRIDHTLKNISVLKQFNSYFDHLSFEDEFGSSFIMPSEWDADLPLGTVISLAPIDGDVREITTHGLKYALKNESLACGIRDGSSNHSVSKHVKISAGEGTLLLFVGHHLPLKK